MATFKEYKVALISRFHIAKEEDGTGILLNLTPAQMRQFFILRLNDINKSDEVILRVFFETKDSETLLKSIQRCNIDKFKPVISFLKEERDSENSSRVEVAAILIDFEKRPFQKFSGMKFEMNKVKNENVAVEVDNQSFLFLENRRKTPKWLFLFLGVVGLFGVGYTTKDVFMPTKECMQWQKDRYELVDCNTSTVNLLSESAIIPIDHTSKVLKKIVVKDTTTYFKGERPIVWYSKVNGIPECFNNSGFHPETGKPLKPITKYIINKYFRKK